MEYVTLNVLRHEDRPRVAERLANVEVEGTLVWGRLEDPAIISDLLSPDDPVVPPRTWRSNPHAPGRQRSADESDLWNNTHIIRVPDPEPGSYTAYVLANSKPYGQGQRFALAYSGRISAIGVPWRET